jgi:asparagine synthase (glutamine-hydrolysing)
MFNGILSQNLNPEESRKHLEMMTGSSGATDSIYSFSHPFGGIVGLRNEFADQASVATDQSKQISIYFYGALYRPLPVKGVDPEMHPSIPAGEALGLYEIAGLEGLRRLNGRFACLIADSRTNKVFLLRDQIGLMPLYYSDRGGKVIFSTSIWELARHPDLGKRVDPAALYRYLLFNYLPGELSIFSGIKKVRPGHLIRLDGQGISMQPYWRLSFADPFSLSEEEIRSDLLNLFRKSIQIRTDKNESAAGAFLSGGMDSSTVVGLLRSMTDKPIHSYSFRCKGRSFDESGYARIMSDSYGTEHHPVEYSADEVLSLPNLVEHMDEPFSDIGIEIASFILGRAAQGQVSSIFTGDGGDELFGGHPVYLAERTARRFDSLPHGVRRFVQRAVGLLPDTDDKKSFAVKAKRFAYSVNFPAALHSNRWRIYYLPHEIRSLCTPELSRTLAQADPLSEFIHLYNEADGPDPLSRTLYGDYHTVVHFYLRRMDLLRGFGLTGRFPMFDPELVAYAARIPSSLKIRNNKETKYILHRTMTGVLPDSIVFRRDKLGHSVPFKNWIRESDPIQQFIRSVLSESNLKKRGFFNPSFIDTLLNEHLRKKHNHSHRLWALVVLETWMNHHQIQ